MIGNEVPKVFTFQCQQCGTPIPVRVPGQSLTFVCPSCSTIVQEDDKGVRIIRETQSSHYKSLFELGAKVIFRGDKWQILGFMVRSDIEESYFWREYLLFNPKLGYRTLHEAEGHWNFYIPVRHKPDLSNISSRSSIVWGGHRYKIYYRGVAKVAFVLGEFYWRVKTGDTVSVADYIAPPDILSSEETADEIVWSAGTYIPSDDIQKAFFNVLIGRMPTPTGVAPNQPSPHADQKALWLHWAAFVAVLIGIQMIWFKGPEHILINQSLYRDPTKVSETLTSQAFGVSKDDTIVKVEVGSPIRNTWLNVTGTLVPRESQMQAFGFARDLSYYAGYEGGESWSEGETSTTFIFPHMKAGNYHLKFDLLRDPAAQPNMSNVDLGSHMNITVIQGHNTAWPFWISFLALTLFPLFRYVQRSHFEALRQANSNSEGL